MVASRRSLKVVRLLIGASLILSATLGHAQPIVVGDVTYSPMKTMGTVGAVGPGWIQLKGVHTIQIVVSDQQLVELKKSTFKLGDPPIKTEITVNGKADRSFLAKDQFVTFSAELKNNKVVDEVKELTLFTPSPTHSLGITNMSGLVSDNAKTPPIGTNLISGQIVSSSKGQLMVAVPNETGRGSMKLIVAIAESAKVDVRLGDLSLVQPGDTVSVQGYVGARNGQPPSNTMLAEVLEVTLAKPLISKTKRRELAIVEGSKKKASSRTPKEEQNSTPLAPKPGNEEPPGGLRDPSMPEKPQASPAATAIEGSRVEDMEKSDEDEDPAEALLVRDTFVVDGNHAAQK